ncbi:MAG: winged helix DNA-binding protein [Deltaproteobacteria bacterium]|nr:winged helix DNA-binding protein [Deltaproteobacteria bacterium]
MADTRQPVEEDLAAALMSLFLPIHYRIGIGFEETLRCGQLSRKQVAILWLMRAEGGPEGGMRRKDIERLLASWFETSSSTITRSLAALARPPLKLVRVREDPDSGREKRVVLTPKGEQFLVGMTAEGRTFAQKLLDGMPRQEIREMVRLMQKAVGVLEREGAERNSSTFNNANRKSAKSPRGTPPRQVASVPYRKKESRLNSHLPVSS